MKIQQTDLPRGRTHLWNEMVKLSALGSFSIRDLMGRQNGMSRQAIKHWLQFCIAAGAVDVVSRSTLTNGFPCARYIVPPGRISPPVQRQTNSTHGDRQQQLWNALRATPHFITCRELSMAASTDAVPVSHSLVAHYCNALFRAGYLSQTRQKRAIFWRLKLAMNTGPKAPAALRGGCGCYDFNLKQVVNVTGLERSAA
jgi:hypothetical protein